MIFQRAVCRQVSDALRRGLSHSGRAGQAAAFDVPAGKTIKEIVEGLNDKDRAEFEEHLGRLSVESPGQRWARLNADPKDPPSWLQCRISFVHNMVPFIGFGFLDNLVMILVGDYIDNTIGIYFHISILAAAALGNTCSDLAGIFFGGYVEYMADKFGLPQPRMTPEQEDTGRARFSKNFGQAFGIVVGCLLGMFPLLFMEPKYVQKTSTED